MATSEDAFDFRPVQRTQRSGSVLGTSVHVGDGDGSREEGHSIKGSLKRMGSTVHVGDIQAWVLRLQKRAVTRFVFLPHGPFSTRWDFIVILMLCYTAVVTPFEVAYLGIGLTDDTHRRTILFAVNRFVDFVFLCDILINFNLGYQITGDIYAEGSRRRLVTDHRAIAHRYLTSWFAVDFVSILPFDEIGQIVGSTDVDALKILRTLRLLRLFKLLRVLRVLKIIDRLEDNWRINSNWFSLLNFIVLILLLTHWFACGYHAVARFEQLADGELNWVDRYFGAFGLSEADLTPYQVHIAALYFSLVTLSTTGYGDINAGTDTERLYLFFEIFVGASCWAYVLGSVTNLISNIDRQNYDFQERMNLCNEFMSNIALPPSLQSRVRRFFTYRRRFQGSKMWVDLAQEMSPSIRAEVSQYRIGRHLKAVSLLRGCTLPSGLVAEVASLLVYSTFSRADFVVPHGGFHKSMYIIDKGCIGGTGRLFLPGSVLGEEALMERGRVCMHVLTALVVTDCYVLDGERLKRAVSHYPVVAAYIARGILRRAAADASVAFWRKWSRALQPQSRRRAGSITAGLEHTPIMRELMARDAAVAAFVTTAQGATFGSLASGGAGIPQSAKAKPAIRHMMVRDERDVGGRTAALAAACDVGIVAERWLGDDRRGGGEGGGDDVLPLSPLSPVSPMTDEFGAQSPQAAVISHAWGGDDEMWASPPLEASSPLGLMPRPSGSGALDAVERPPDVRFLDGMAPLALRTLSLSSLLTALGASPITAARAAAHGIGPPELVELSTDVTALETRLGMSLGVAARTRRYLRAARAEFHAAALRRNDEWVGRGGGRGDPLDVSYSRDAAGDPTGVGRASVSDAVLPGEEWTDGGDGRRGVGVIDL